MMVSERVPGKRLVSEGQGRQFLVKTVFKQDQYGLGVLSSSSRHPQVTHSSAHDVRAVRRKGRRQQEEDKQQEGEGKSAGEGAGVGDQTEEIHGH